MDPSPVDRSVAVVALRACIDGAETLDEVWRQRVRGAGRPAWGCPSPVSWGRILAESAALVDGELSQVSRGAVFVAGATAMQGVAGRVAEAIGWNGTACEIVDPGAAALLAVHAAVRELQFGDADAALVVAVDPPAFQQDGGGRGLVLFALERLTDAPPECVHAIVRGTGTAAGNRTVAPWLAVERAWAAADRPPSRAGWVGVGDAGARVPAGDLASTLRAQLQASADDRSVLGGGTALLTAVLAVRHGALPAAPEDGAVRPWFEMDGQPRCAAVHGCSAAGVHVHAVVEAVAGRVGAKRLQMSPVRTGWWSAGTPDALLVRLDEWLDSCGSMDIAAFCRASVTRPAAGSVRLGVMARDGESFAQAVSDARARIAVAPNAAWELPGSAIYRSSSVAGPVCVLCPGAGAPRDPGGLAAAFDEARRPWEVAARSGDPGLQELLSMAFGAKGEPRSADGLLTPAGGQPAVVAAGLAQWELLRVAGVSASHTAGLGVGEVTALCVAGCLTPEEALLLARRRGECVGKAMDAGDGVLSVQAAPGPVRDAVASLPIAVEEAGSDHPQHCRWVGAEADLARLATHADARGWRSVLESWPLGVQSARVAAAVVDLRARLSDLRFERATVRPWSAATARPYPEASGPLREMLARQVAIPVRCGDTVRAMYEAGARVFIALGAETGWPAAVERTLDGLPHVVVATAEPGRDGVHAWWWAISQLWAAGVSLDVAELLAGFARPDRAAPSLASFDAPEVDAPPPSELHQLFRASEDRLLAAHTAFQQTMERSHSAFLAAVTQQWTAWGVAQPSASPRVPSAVVPAASDVRDAGPAASGGEPPTGRPRSGGRWIGTTQRVRAAVPAVSCTAAVDLSVPTLPAATPVETPNRPESEPAPVTSSPEQQASPAWRNWLARRVGAASGVAPELLVPELQLDDDLGLSGRRRDALMDEVRASRPDAVGVDRVDWRGFRTLGELFRALCGVSSAPVMRDTVPGDLVVPPRAPGDSGPAEPPLADAMWEDDPVVAPAVGEAFRYAVRAVERAPSGLGMPGLEQGTLLVIDDGRGVAQALAVLLRGAGYAVRIEDRLVGEPHGVIFLAGLYPTPDRASAMALNREAFLLAQALAPRFEADGGLLVTVRDAGGDFGLSGRAGHHAWASGLSALVKSAGLEWPRASVKSIDLQVGLRDAQALAQALFDELVAGGPEIDVALGVDGQRRVPEAVAAPITVFPRQWTQDDVFVVSGGARGITGACVVDMARRTGGRFALLGASELLDAPVSAAVAPDASAVARLVRERAAARGELVTQAQVRRRVRAVFRDREVRATLGALAECGVEADYFVCDVAEADAVHGVLERIREAWGPVTAVVHGVTTEDVDRLTEKTVAAFDRVFAAKVVGLANLLDATVSDPVRFVGLFSSVAARTGLVGRADDAMANEVLNKVAAALRHERPDCTVRALGWGPWEGVDVGHLSDVGGAPLPRSRGCSLWVDEVLGAGDDVEVVLVGPGFEDTL